MRRMRLGRKLFWRSWCTDVILSTLMARVVHTWPRSTATTAMFSSRTSSRVGGRFLAESEDAAFAICTKGVRHAICTRPRVRGKLQEGNGFRE